MQLLKICTISRNCSTESVEKITASAMLDSESQGACSWEWLRNDCLVLEDIVLPLQSPDELVGKQPGPACSTHSFPSRRNEG